VDRNVRNCEVIAKLKQSLCSKSNLLFRSSTM